MTNDSDKNTDNNIDNNTDQMQKIAAILEQMGIAREKNVPKTSSDYKFWNSQPVVKLEEVVDEEGPIDLKTVDMISKEAYPLPKDFEWVTVDLESRIEQVYELLSNNYVEDDSESFRFDYSAEFLKWQVVANKKLVGFISGIPGTLRLRDHVQKVVEINFLCVHKKLRAKRLAPVLIKEITRRINLNGIFQATYTAGMRLPTPITTCTYFHRSLNPKKLVEIGFCGLRPGETIEKMTKSLRLPQEPLIPGWRVMQDKDVDQVTRLLNGYLKNFVVAPEFTDDEVRHWFLPREKVLFAYVVEDPDSLQLTDFISFYNLPSSILQSKDYSTLNVSYLYYYVPKDNGKDPKRLTTLVKDALISAKKNNFDVFNALNLMRNGDFIDELRFLRGDGNLNFYLYNYRLLPVDSQEIGLFLIFMMADAGDKNGQKVNNIQELLVKLNMSANRKTKTEDFKFWSTIPVTKIEDPILEEGPIDANIDIDQVSADPLHLPNDFEWVSIDLDTRMNELYEFLRDNYVENAVIGFRFTYSIAMLEWGLIKDPKFKDWILGVQVKANKKLVGFITAYPGTLRIREVVMPIANVNLMCVHKKLRDKRLSPLLIKELARRCKRQGYFQALATSGRRTPTPFSAIRYFHRSLNPKKLIDIGYSRLRPTETLSRITRLLKTNDQPVIPGWRSMQDKDVSQVTKLLNEYLKNFQVAPVFSPAEVRERLLPKECALYSFVVEDQNTHQVTDFISFYVVDGVIFNNPKHSSLKSGFLYYMVPKGFGKDPNRMIQLITDALSVANKNEFDVFNAVGHGDNMHFFKDLRFNVGNADLFYYFYNYNLKPIPPKDLGALLF